MFLYVKKLSFAYSLLEHVSIVNTWVGTDGSSNLYKWVGSWTSLGAFRFWKVLNDRTARGLFLGIHTYL
ncbi:hypothetical protein RhiirC2_735931 [Rhizophagus irregularis]|uniref:Uncharacterized protein n=1 Tax=Rhizophagus irregularis TaxID=588596 RepID=A0A2N1NPA6_9GLOM|nr:hypothetical protein RhiirC2_735931 [Rhizophagus irregularis]